MLHGRPLIHTDLCDLEVRGVEVEVVLSIRNSGKQDLLDEPGSLALAEGQQVGCLFNRKSADLVSNQTCLLSRGLSITMNCYSLHLYFSLAHFAAGAGAAAGAPAAAFLSEGVWPLNVRVGANSPSLCPTMSSVM